MLQHRSLYIGGRNKSLVYKQLHGGSRVLHCRKVYLEREQAYEASVKLYGDASPGDIGVPLKLFPSDPASPQGSYPYESAVQELTLLVHDRCPQRKLECIGESGGGGSFQTGLTPHERLPLASGCHSNLVTHVIVVLVHKASILV